VKNNMSSSANMSGTSRLLRNTLANVSAHVVTAAVAFITLPFMLAHFGMGYYGVFALVISLVAFVALFDLGMTTVLIKRVAQIDVMEHPQEFAGTIRLGRRWLALFGIINAVILGMLGFAPFLIANLQSDEVFLFRAMLALYALSQLIIWPAKIGNIICAGRQRYDVIALTNIAVALANTCAIVTVLLLGRGPLVLTACFVAISSIASIALAVYALRMQKISSAVNANGTNRLLSNASRHLLRLALPIFVIQIAVFTMQQQADRVILGIMLGAAAIALYEVAAKLGALLFQIIGLAISATPSFVAHKETVTTREGMNDFFLTGSRYLSLLLMPTFMIVLVFTPAIIHVWVGPEFAISTIAAQFLIASALPFPLLILIDSILIARDQYKVWLPFAILVAIINLIVTALLVLQLGLIGVAIGTFVAALCDVACKLWVLRSTIQCPVRKWIQRVLLPATIAVGISAVLAIAFTTIAVPVNLTLLLIGLCATIALSYAIIFSSILSSDERSTCLRLARSVTTPWQRTRKH